MVHGEKPTTSSGNLKAPPMETYLEWICTAWDSLSKQLIIEYFPSCGISSDTEGKVDGVIPNGLDLLRQRSFKNTEVNEVEEIDSSEDEKENESDLNLFDLWSVSIACKIGNWISYFSLALYVERLWLYTSR
jgi:hypothetical protein